MIVSRDLDQVLILVSWFQLTSCVTLAGLHCYLHLRDHPKCGPPGSAILPRYLVLILFVLVRFSYCVRQWYFWYSTKNCRISTVCCCWISAWVGGQFWSFLLLFLRILSPHLFLLLDWTKCCFFLHFLFFSSNFLSYFLYFSVYLCPFLSNVSFFFYCGVECYYVNSSILVLRSTLVYHYFYAGYEIFTHVELSSDS